MENLFNELRKEAKRIAKAWQEGLVIYLIIVIILTIGIIIGAKTGLIR